MCEHNEVGSRVSWQAAHLHIQRAASCVECIRIPLHPQSPAWPRSPMLHLMVPSVALSGPLSSALSDALSCPLACGPCPYISGLWPPASRLYPLLLSNAMSGSAQMMDVDFAVSKVRHWTAPITLPSKCANQPSPAPPQPDKPAGTCWPNTHPQIQPLSP